MSKISEKNNSNLRIALYRKLDTLSFDRFNSEYSGDIVARFNNDIPNIKMFISKTVIRLITDALIILFTITMIFTIKLDLSGIFACFIPVYILIIYYSYVKTKKYYKDHQNDLGNLVGMLGEYLPRRLMFHSFGVKKYLENQITSYNDKQEESFVKSRFYSEAFNPLNFLIINFLQLGLYIIAGFYVLDGTIDVGTFSAFILYIQLFKRPVLTMGFILNSVKLSFASLDRIFEILDMDEDEPTGGANLDCSNLKGEIEIKDVCHGNLDDFSLKIHSRECVKITGYYYDLADVILRLKTPAKGSIYLDGQDISQFDLKSYRSAFGVCPEDDWIINGTIRENILYGREKIPQHDIEKTCKLIGLDELVERFPQGYDSKLSGDFPNFSRGEAKLICLARALVSNPKILIITDSNYISDSLLKEISHGKTLILLSADDSANDFSSEVIHI
jgi:ATP-binding cassette subfamily B protein